jgi:hypothetical protein
LIVARKRGDEVDVVDEVDEVDGVDSEEGGGSTRGWWGYDRGMSNNTRDLPRRIAAARKVERDGAGEPVMPVVVARNPGKGMCHPLGRAEILGFLAEFELEYVEGVKKIELLAGRVDRIGEPFGEYDREKRLIVLYALPEGAEWRVRNLSGAAVKSLEDYAGTVLKGRDGVFVVSWKDPSWQRTMMLIHLTSVLGMHAAYENRGRVSVPTLKERWGEAALQRSKLMNAWLEKGRAERGE